MTRSATPRLRRRPGFTLFEVMAAVLVLGVLYSVLATSAIQGLRSEGESKRRLEASLLVDEELTALESGLATGLLPAVGVEESELGDYLLRIEVAPFDVTPYLGETYQEAREQGGAGGLLEPPDREEESLLRRVSVSVHWREAEGLYEVRRTTLAYDQGALASLLPAAGEEPPEQDLSQFENPDGTPNFDAMLEHLRKLSGDGL